MYNHTQTLEYGSVSQPQKGGVLPGASSGARRRAPGIGTFLSVLTSVFVVSVLLLIRFDFYPEPVGSHQEEARLAAAAEIAAEEASEIDSSTIGDTDPVRVIIDSVGIDMPINNPASTNIAVLDASLLSGVVRYPGSAGIGEGGNMLLFGHSSYLPVVNNRSFKAFNGIQNLTSGEVIRVQSEGYEAVYRVVTVRKEKASEAVIDLDTKKQMLTLVTCNTFGEKSDRYVVEAEFVGSYPIAQ